MVSERKASIGDTAAVGKELIKVIDPASVRFDGFVSADKISTVKLGQHVSFRVNGYGQQDFAGVVKRIDAAADPTTRQVEVLVNFVEKTVPSVSGLYAEGRIETSSSAALMLPAIALVRNGDHAFAWRVQSGVLKKISIVLGERDPRSGDYADQQRSGGRRSSRAQPAVELKDGAEVEKMASAATEKKGN